MKPTSRPTWIPAGVVLLTLCSVVCARNPARGQTVVTPSTEETGWWASTQRSMKQTTNFMMGRELLDSDRARELYQQGDAAFREAAAARAPVPRDGDQSPGNQSEFYRAAKLFRRASEAEPDSALGQDAQFMYAESLFFADRLADAAEAYQLLQKNFPRNRHSDRVAARLFSITQYWIDTEKASEDKWFTLNLFDKTRPRVDVDGHAVRVLDQIRYDDPTGRLADDATMAAAAEYLRQEKFQMADEFLTDLRETFPDSEHFFLAHLLGIRCKLELYAGPLYSSLMLEEADKLIEQIRQRFPDQLREQRYADMVARAAAEIDYLRGEHLFERARYREKRREYRAATEYYQEILEHYPDTPFGKESRERLERTSSLPAVPQQRLSWLKRIFPDERSASPLELNFESPSGEKRETILR